MYYKSGRKIDWVGSCVNASKFLFIFFLIIIIILFVVGDYVVCTGLLKLKVNACISQKAMERQRRQQPRFLFIYFFDDERLLTTTRPICEARPMKNKRETCMHRISDLIYILEGNNSRPNDTIRFGFYLFFIFCCFAFINRLVLVGVYLRVCVAVVVYTCNVLCVAHNRRIYSERFVYRSACMSPQRYTTTIQNKCRSVYGTQKLFFILFFCCCWCCVSKPFISAD